MVIVFFDDYFYFCLLSTCSNCGDIIIISAGSRIHKQYNVWIIKVTLYYILYMGFRRHRTVCFV